MNLMVKVKLNKKERESLDGMSSMNREDIEAVGKMVLKRKEFKGFYVDDIVDITDKIYEVYLDRI